jgi:hypothetical protein
MFCFYSCKKKGKNSASEKYSNSCYVNSGNQRGHPWAFGKRPKHKAFFFQKKLKAKKHPSITLLKLVLCISFSQTKSRHVKVNCNDIYNIKTPLLSTSDTSGASAD